MSDRTHFADDDTLAYIAKLEAENAALREDAERYRWLREPQEFICVDQDLDGNFRSLIRKELDAAIDSARSK